MHLTIPHPNPQGIITDRLKSPELLQAAQPKKVGIRPKVKMGVLKKAHNEYILKMSQALHEDGKVAAQRRKELMDMEFKESGK